VYGKDARPLFIEERPSFWQALPKLLGHVIGGTVIFLSLALLAWLLGWAITRLNTVEAFSPAVLNVLHQVELGLLYLDIGLSGIVVAIGAIRFVKEIV
jgi:hypothetical protein